MDRIENVYIFVSDALRLDYLPDTVRSRGDVLKTIAASTLSPTSFASLTSGLYPPQHGVWTFAHRVDENRNWMLEADTHDTAFWQFSKDDPIYEVLDQDPSITRRVDKMDPPFINIERDLITHAPYGLTNEEQDDYEAGEFLDDYAGSLDELQMQYRKGAERAANLFVERLNALKDRGLLNDTLVIFTSDHGELLGEYGSLSHVYPVTPESVYVPTVLIHPKGTKPKPKSAFSHVDVTATIADVLGIEIPYKTPGISAYNSSDRSHAYSGFEFPREYGAFGQSDSINDRFPTIINSIWDSEGGWVFNDSPRQSQILNLLKYAMPKSSRQRKVMRQNMRGTLSLVSQVFSRSTSFNSPDIDRVKARRLVEEVRTDKAEVDKGIIEDEQLQRLKDLGYR